MNTLAGTGAGCFLPSTQTEGGTTFCPSCQAALIERDWYNIRHYDLPADGRCPHCGTLIAGHFTRFGKPFGARRVPVRLERR